MRYFIELSYNGKDYHGWQNQPTAISVQEVLENVLSTLLDESIAIVGAGRTDAGVHAKQMFAHFETEMLFEKQDIIYKLNSFLPKDIAVSDVFQVQADAHARFDAVSRTYLYRIALQKNVFNYDYAYAVKLPLNVNKMKEAARILLDYNDFQCFSKSNTNVKTYYCDIMKASWEVVDGELQFTIQADRFLRNMVRAIVGTLVNIGLEKISVSDMHTIIKSKSRSEAGFSAPAHGLYLTKIEYPERIKNDK